MLIAPRLESSARKYLRTFPAATMKKGAGLFASSAVRDVEMSRDDICLAEVMGTMLYHATLAHEDGEWFGECTCPVEVDCKHCYAAMRALLEWTGVPAAKPVAQAPGQPAKASRASRQTFTADIEQKLGRELTNGEKHVVVTIENLFKHHARSAHVAEYLLAPLLGRASSWQYEMHRLWPSPPRDAWEAWLYLAHFLRSRKKSAPPFLAEITTEQEVETFVHAWQRREAIEHWSRQLGNFAARVEMGTVGIIDLRAIFAEIGVRLEASEDGGATFELVKKSHYAQMEREFIGGRLQLTAPAALIWSAFRTGAAKDGVLRYDTPNAAAGLNELLRNPLLADRMLGVQRAPLRRAEERLQWKIEPASAETDDYRFTLIRPDGSPPPPALVAVDGQPALYVTIDAIYEAPPLGGLSVTESNRVPAPALETNHGLALLDAIGAEPPPRIAERTRTVRARAVFHCTVEPLKYGTGEIFKVEIRGDLGEAARPQRYLKDGWQDDPAAKPAAPVLARVDRSALRATPRAVEELCLNWNPYEHGWDRPVGKKFPGELAGWLAALPAGIEAELDPLLATLRDAPISASVRLDVEEAGVDWFDLRVALDVADTTLTQEELKLLLDAGGGYVRLGAKGWRRLQFNFSDEDEQQLAELGLSAREFSSEPQRLHALQLAGKKAARLMPERHFAAIERKVGEIQTRVAPPVPDAIRAALRPYQIEGFHFLAYLTANRFGGILADDMGLGKTLQALAWLAWLPADKMAHPSLVVCPKSVMTNWSAEAAHFAPSIRVRLLHKGACDAAALKAARAEADVVVANYTQLRLLEAGLTATPWRAVILDEAQYIKNPESQTARIALALKAAHRLALSGTPIENRLLDLWSIMAFAMPGVLGNRAQFTRRFDQKNDPLARLRLSARVRPFLLRRTKGEVAKDLPDRIEEDLVCEMDGMQATLYRAELKRARQQLLKLKTARELDQARFNILTSLLRLRQICCHPVLVSENASNAESAKLGALLDLLEPLIEEGHKVLVFSQFVEMLALIRAEIESRGWRQFLLTGQTEERGPLVADFQKCEGPAVFLISLRAGGFGLNLTAASYVVLFDPWWNPAVENQAIDRTHRIGQTSKVIAYRLLVKDSIEEKIRHLQKQKRALAADILGEESFARGLTMDDFQFLLSE
jgi:superfamily II DNA or RNA helicase